MPTGYTSMIQEGTTFQKFTLACARQFGALIMMRDDPADAPIPDKMEPSNYHAEQLEKARKDKEWLLSLNGDEKKWESDKYNDYELSRWVENESRKTEIRNKYNEMLAKVVEWEPPTQDHTGLKEFMLQQIRDSIKWDCDPYEKPTVLTPDQWYEKRLKDVNWSIDYHLKGNREEIERSNGRTEWIQQLKKSLDLN